MTSKTKSNARLFLLTATALGVFALSQTLFVLMPAESGLVIHLGDLKSDENGNDLVYQSGLHIKVPIVDRLVVIDKRLQSFDVPSTRVLTKDKKYVLVDYYTKWLVNDFSLFYQRTGANFFRAQDILKRKISDALRAEFGTRNLSDIISGEERNTIIQRLQVLASESAENIGVKVWDVRLKRIDFPQENAQSVYERMKSSRVRDSKRYRAEGAAKAEEIRAEADSDARIIIAKAKRDAAEKVAEGNQLAAEIFNGAYGKSQDGFYEFFLKMQAYKEAIHNNEVMVISPENDRFFSMLNERG